MSQIPPYGPQWQAYGPAPLPPKKPRRWPWVVGGAFLLLVVVGVAGGNSSPSTSTAPPAGIPSGVDPQKFNANPTPVEGGIREETWAPSGPLAQFGAGTYEVGTGDDMVAPGKYKTNGPETGDYGSCYWARLKNTNGDFDAIITNGNAQGPTTITVGKNDGAFETRCTWTKVGA